MVDEELVQKWAVLKERLKNIKADEMDLRKQIADHILKGKIKGVQKGVIGKYNLTATGKINTSVDKELLQHMWPVLTPEEKQAIRFKPELVAKNYKTLDSKSKIHKAILSKPGAPGLEVKGVN